MRSSIFSRRRTAVLLLLAAATAGLACGRNQVVLDVDARSFMNNADMVHPYSAPGLVPFSIRLDSIPVNLVEGFKDFGTAESGSIDLGIVYDNVLGTGAGRFRLYFSDDPATLFSTTPVAILDADLAPATAATRTAHIQADERVLGLFTGKEFWMGADLEWLSNTLEPLQGTATISQINLHLVSTMALFN
jgi:hypothetical protein